MALVSCPEGPKPGSLIDEITETHADELNKKVLNILLLGQTGVGKSTFINAFVNYLRFPTLEEAEKGTQIECLIPSCFTVTHPESFESIKVTLGNLKDDDNERQDRVGMSSTQSCKCYDFNLDEVRIRLIDAPGIGDTRGIDYDRRNFDDILAFVGEFHYLHGICILLKPNETRLTATFEFCIKQLFCHLAKTASRNICFVFTNSRSTFYQPGETAPVLREVLKNVRETPPNAEVPFSIANAFCVDNEAFRFLVAVKNRISFAHGQKQSFAGSWKASAASCKSLIDYVTGLEPHPVAHTVSVNEARRFILELSKPLADILENIQDNQKVLQDKVLELQNRKKSVQELRDALFIPVVDLDMVEFDQPRTVCTSEKCRKLVNFGDVKKFHYLKPCHSPCHLTSVEREIVDNPKLRRCEAMNASGVCKRCSCSYRLHMHIYYDTQEVERKIVDENVQSQITTHEQAQNAAEKLKGDLTDRCRKFEEEQVAIQQITAKFAHFLKNNAIAPYNDAFKRYLEHLIENQQSLAAKGSNNEGIIRGLQDSLKAYEQEKATLEEAMKSQSAGQCQVSVEEIFDMKSQLYKLEHSGPTILKMHAAQRKPRESEHYEKRIVPYKGIIKNILFKGKKSVLVPV